MSTDASPAESEGRAPESEEPGGFVGRGGWHLVAFLAALALILVMSIDWYTDERGEELRRIEDTSTRGQELGTERQEDAANAAETREKTAWQADAFIDRLILLSCLIAFVGAVVAAFMRSAGRRPTPPWHPSAIATVAGVAATLLILYRMIQPPGLNEAAVIKIGAPLGLVAVGVLTIGSRLAVLVERDELAGGGAVAAAGPAAEPPPEPASDAEAPEKEPRPGLLARLRSRRGDRAAADAAGEGPAAEAPAVEAGQAAAFEFDFPAPPPAVGEREESVPAEEPPIEEPPVEEPPIGEPPVEEPPPAGEPEPEESPVEEPAPEEMAGFDELPPANAVNRVEEAPPVDDGPAGAESPEEAPLWAPPDPDPAPAEAEPLEDVVDEEPPEPEPLPGELSVADQDLPDEPVEEEPEADEDEPADAEFLGATEEGEGAEPDAIVDEPVDDDPVEPVPLGEEIEFEYDSAPAEPDEPDEPDEPGTPADPAR